jgi:hypothetical protein
MHVVNDANDMLLALGKLNEIARQIQRSQIIIDANGAATREASETFTPDTVAQRIIKELVETLCFITNQILESLPPPNIQRTIIQEQEHYKASKKRNELSANYQRRKKMGGTIGQKSMPKITSAPPISPEAKAFYQNDLARIETELQRQTSPVPAAKNSPAAPNYNAEGVKRHLPPLDELNTIPDTFL